jgi:hypothetical protein
MLKLDIPYRLIPRAEIAADDARLHQKYPGTWQRLPESKEIAYVSTVGFNVNKAKAIVHIGLRSQGWVVRLEKRDGSGSRCRTDARGSPREPDAATRRAGPRL